jgi:AraC-like DNA-binding protein
VHYREIAPPAPLDRWVRCFWFLTTGGGGPPQPIVPDGRLEIVLHRAEPFEQLMPDDTARPQEAVMVSGQLTRPIVLCARGPSDIIGIRFRTAAARDLLRLPLGELTDRVVGLHEVSGVLAAALDAAGRSADPVRALCGALLDRMRGHAHRATSVAVGRLARGESVAGVARAAGLSTRTLERRVRDDTGLPPKVLQQVVRFRAFYVLLHSGAANGARAAAMAGYYDQTHANRDFRRFAGSSPTAHFADDPQLARAILSHSS